MLWYACMQLIFWKVSVFAVEGSFSVSLPWFSRHTALLVLEVFLLVQKFAIQQKLINQLSIEINCVEAGKQPNMQGSVL